MKTYTVFVNRYNEWADKPYRGTIRTFFVADWTDKMIEEMMGLEGAQRRYPAVARFDVSSYNTEEAQRELTHKVCDYLNKLELARSKVKVEL